MESIPCDIVLLPSTDIANQAIEISENLESGGTLFTLTDTDFYPHLSLYMVQLKTVDLDQIMFILAQVAKRAKTVELVAKDFHQVVGYVDIEYKRTIVIEKLQMLVINAVNPIRDGLRQKDRIRLETATGKERENIELYGYRSVGTLFEPHITLTRFEDIEPINLDMLGAKDRFSGSFLRIGLFETGDNGTCRRKIAEYNLGGL